LRVPEESARQDQVTALRAPSGQHAWTSPVRLDTLESGRVRQIGRSDPIDPPDPPDPPDPTGR